MTSDRNRTKLCVYGMVQLRSEVIDLSFSIIELCLENAILEVKWRSIWRCVINLQKIAKKSVRVPPPLSVLRSRPEPGLFARVGAETKTLFRLRLRLKRFPYQNILIMLPLSNC